MDLNELNNSVLEIRSNFERIFFYNYYLVNQMYLTGCRYSELDFNLYSPIGNGNFELKGTKNSNTRIINVSQFDSTFLEMLINPSKRNPLVCYSTLISQLNICSKGNFIKIKSKWLHCHIFRHLYIKNYFEKCRNIAQTKTDIGHKDLKTTIGYIFSDIQKN